jgi:hypothetical protein
LTLQAACDAEVVRNGKERGEDNLWIGKAGAAVTYTFAEDTEVHSIRLVFDSDLNRKSKNMPCSYPLKQERYRVPETLVRAYRIEGVGADGIVHTISVTENHQRLVYHTVNWNVQEVRFVPISTYGCEEMHLFSFELL